MLPILNLNGYKIANPTLLARIRHEELESLFIGYGYTPYFVEGSDPDEMHQRMAATLDTIAPNSGSSEAGARKWRGRAAALADDRAADPQGLDRPEGGRWPQGRGLLARAPGALSDVRGDPAKLQLLEFWLRSYDPEALFDQDGRLRTELRALAPEGRRRMSANPHANGGVLRKELKLPDFRDYAVKVEQAGKVLHENTKPLGDFLRDVMRENMTSLPGLRSRRDRVEPPAVDLRGEQEGLDGRDAARGRRRRRAGPRRPGDGDAVRHTLVGWQEGYLLTGRHGFFHTYEAFAHVVNSMFNQHAKWLDISKNHVPWRASVSSQNILLSSTVWRQDHDGFSHQDPGFIDLVTNKSPTVSRVYLPPDANTLLVVADECLRSTDCINVIVADKQKHLQFTTIDEAIVHCAKGFGIWRRASNDEGSDPDVVIASCGDVATQERWQRPRSFASAFPTSRFASSTWWTSSGCSSRACTRMARPTATSTACSPSTSR